MFCVVRAGKRASRGPGEGLRRGRDCGTCRRFRVGVRGLLHGRKSRDCAEHRPSGCDAMAAGDMVNSDHAAVARPRSGSNVPAGRHHCTQGCCRRLGRQRPSSRCFGSTMGHPLRLPRSSPPLRCGLRSVPSAEHRLRQGAAPIATSGHRLGGGGVRQLRSSGRSRRIFRAGSRPCDCHAAGASAGIGSRRRSARCQSARRQAAAISDRGGGGGAGARDGEVTVVSYDASTGQTRHQHRLRQSVRRAQYPALRSLSAHLRHGGAVQRRPDRSARVGLGEEPARAVRAAQASRASRISSSTTPTPIRSRT